MDEKLKASFLDKWKKYFPGSELPIACYYSDELNGADFPERPKPNKHGLTCIFSQLAPVRRGKARAFNQDNLGCWGSKGVLGFIPSAADEQAINFLVNVERYKKSAEHIKAMFKTNPPLPAEAKYLIFKRWDLLSEKDRPQVVFFFRPQSGHGPVRSQRPNLRQARPAELLDSLAEVYPHARKHG